MVAALTASLGLAACGSTGQSQAVQACIQVNRSLMLYQASLHEPAKKAADDQRKAQTELLAAEPLAAAATSADGSWNGLMTTLIESERVSEGNLVVSLQSECEDVVPGNSPNATNSSGSGSTVTGPTLPPHS